ncbi:hypothetical protein B0F90DRAFT_1670710 [Multifurca ochricompacta]|uniref:Uncharacterized protein n=1 Tax=Multifurca ochricompacta TaxID=376703 RepID=A0AAD4LXC3_9AGAM|nr:hypothetical protein B0F90DRAFT_1670710 [Multifurca ochricompacta]
MTYTHAHTHTPTDLDKSSNIGLKQWLVGHHNSYEHEVTGETIHVYAIAGPPVYSDGDSDRIDFDIELPLWGVTWVLKGYVIKSTLAIDAAFSVKVPIIGSFQLAQVKGNLQDGVKFYYSAGWIYVDLSATVFGTVYGPLTIKLIPLPFGSEDGRGQFDLSGIYNLVNAQCNQYELQKTPREN